MVKEKERLRAIELRKMGWTIPRIVKEVGVTKGSVIGWCREVVLTASQLAAIKTNKQLKVANAKRQERQNRRIKFQREGTKLIKTSPNALLLAGTSLYWAEGAKTDRVMLANSDSGIIKIFVRWLIECLGVDVGRIRYQLNIHEGLNEKEIKEYWKDKLKDILPVGDSQWYKTQIKKSVVGHRKNRLYKGTIYIGIADVNLLYTIEGMIQGLQEELGGS